ncbi:MAG: LysR family transcriptional regulator, partial [Gammaproteobacteria bacterium]|nr:LysR family transcriptional regulator [Gammaproteobacteria bacterium]
MKNLPMDVLRSFVTVAEFGSYTQASELLSRSQPAVSMQIKRLEELLDHSLFQRVDQKLKLTHEGEHLFSLARQILALNDEAVSTLVKPSLSGNIRFGIPSEFATTLLPKIVGRFSQNYPTVSLDVSCDLSINLLSSKKEREFDLILALNDDLVSNKSDRVRTDELVWVTKNIHNAQSQSPVPLIAAQTGCIYRKRAIEKLNKAKQSWRIVYTIPDLSGIQSAIEEGLGVTVLAKSTVPDNLQIIKPGKKFP